MKKPTTFEKNNLPLKTRVQYNDVIQKYQTIEHYENGHIKADELILKLNDNIDLEMELKRRIDLIKSEPNGIVRETMIDTLSDYLFQSSVPQTDR